MVFFFLLLVFNPGATASRVCYSHISELTAVAVHQGRARVRTSTSSPFLLLLSAKSERTMCKESSALTIGSRLKKWKRRSLNRIEGVNKFILKKFKRDFVFSPKSTGQILANHLPFKKNFRKINLYLSATLPLQG